MTKEELEEDVKTYLRQQFALNGGRMVSCDLKKLLLGFAEPREKRIEELEKIIEQMQDAKCISCTDLGGMLLKITDLEKRNTELEQKLEQTEKDLADYQFNYPSIKELSKENTELKEQIEKMKCCSNCKNEGDYKEPYRYGTGWCNICKRHKVAKGNFDKWEIKEND